MTLRLYKTLILFFLTIQSSAQTIAVRIDSLLNLMSMDEKILQLHQEGSMNTTDNLRLEIPGFEMADGPHGVREGLATSFPVGIGMAATWNVDLAQRIGVAMGKEFRGKGKHQALGPCLDIDRDPQFITVDLGSEKYVSNVILRWETTYAKEYKIQISNNETAWTDAAHITDGDGGLDKISIDTHAQFVRMWGIQRAK